MRKIMKSVGLAAAFGVGALALNSCYPPQPEETQNICNVFQQYPEWYWAAKATQDKWKVPIAVQMAIIYEESGFQATAEPPPKEKFAKIIPWQRETTAFGYSQALEQTWKRYQSSTNQCTARCEFPAASDFIGWYANMASQQAHISPNDAYDLYLAYHEGLGGYASHSYWKKPWLVKIAHGVQARSITYQGQLQQCAGSIPKPSTLP